MEQWFLEIWGTINKETNEAGVVEIRSFIHCEEAWQYVVDNHIKSYCLYRAKCIMDAEATVNSYIEAVKENPNIEASEQVKKAEGIIGV